MFKLTCLKCGNEIIITVENGIFFFSGRSCWGEENDEMDIYNSGYQGEITIWCKCGNEIEKE